MCQCLKRLQATTEISWAGTKHLCGRSFFLRLNVESTLSRHRSRRAPQDADTSLRVQVACRGVPQHKSGIVGRDKCDKCDKETCQNHLDLCSFGLIWSENQIRPDAFPWHKFFTASMLLHAFLSSSTAMRGFNLFFYSMVALVPFQAKASSSGQQNLRTRTPISPPEPNGLYGWFMLV